MARWAPERADGCRPPPSTSSSNRATTRRPSRRSRPGGRDRPDVLPALQRQARIALRRRRPARRLFTGAVDGPRRTTRWSSRPTPSPRARSSPRRASRVVPDADGRRAGNPALAEREQLKMVTIAQASPRRCASEGFPTRRRRCSGGRRSRCSRSPSSGGSSTVRTVRWRTCCRTRCPPCGGRSPRSTDPRGGVLRAGRRLTSAEVARQRRRVRVRSSATDTENRPWTSSAGSCLSSPASVTPMRRCASPGRCTCR